MKAGLVFAALAATASALVAPSTLRTGVRSRTLAPLNIEKGSIVRVEYTGWFAASDFKFDSSVDRGVPFTFEIGKGNVIPGWDEGVSTMRVGGKRTMLIPSRLAYGEENIAGGLIPPNSDLRFECELVECNTGALAGMAVGAKDQITGLTGSFGANPFTFFALLLVVTIVGPYVLPEDSPLMK